MPSDITEWREMRPPVSRWRRRSRATIDILQQENPDADRKTILGLLVAAYPFAERTGAAYQAWLKERSIFLAAIAGPPTLPSADEIGVCEVAREMLELAGLGGPERTDEARRLLEEQAPNRLARQCSVCAMASGRPCVDLDTPPADLVPGQLGRPRPGWRRLRDLIVPHHARLVGHAYPGPLFEAR